MSEIKVNKISPASGTETTLGDSSDDFLLPSGAEIIAQSGSTITVASGATIANAGTATGFGGGGKVLQVVQDTLTTEWSTTSGTYTPVVGLSISITPASTSKVLVMGHLVGAVGASTTGGGACVMRDSTHIFVGDADLTQTSRYRGLASYRTDHANTTHQTSINYLDTHGADGSTAVVYTWQVFAEAAGTFYVNTDNAPTINQTYYGQFASSITAVEIGA